MELKGFKPNPPRQFDSSMVPSSYNSHQQQQQQGGGGMQQLPQFSNLPHVSVTPQAQVLSVLCIHVNLLF